MPWKWRCRFKTSFLVTFISNWPKHKLRSFKDPTGGPSVLPEFVPLEIVCGYYKAENNGAICSVLKWSQYTWPFSIFHIFNILSLSNLMFENINIIDICCLDLPREAARWRCFNGFCWFECGSPSKPHVRWAEHLRSSRNPHILEIWKELLHSTFLELKRKLKHHWSWSSKKSTMLWLGCLPRLLHCVYYSFTLLYFTNSLLAWIQYE